jgi:hypothetical protein
MADEELAVGIVVVESKLGVVVAVSGLALM